MKVTVTDGHNAVIQELTLSVRTPASPASDSTAAPAATQPPSPAATAVAAPAATPQQTSTLAPAGIAACSYQGATDTATITALILAEGAAANTADLQTIQAIFRHDALIQDGVSHQIWTNPISRYAGLFETTAFRAVAHYDIQAVGPGILGDTAYFASGSRGEYRSGGDWQSFENLYPSDHWILRKNAVGCWQISEFTFNSSHIPFP